MNLGIQSSYMESESASRLLLYYFQSGRVKYK